MRTPNPSYFWDYDFQILQIFHPFARILCRILCRHDRRVLTTGLRHCTGSIPV